MPHTYKTEINVMVWLKCWATNPRNLGLTLEMDEKFYIMTFEFMKIKPKHLRVPLKPVIPAEEIILTTNIVGRKQVSQYSTQNIFTGSIMSRQRQIVLLLF